MISCCVPMCEKSHARWLGWTQSNFGVQPVCIDIQMCVCGWLIHTNSYEFDWNAEKISFFFFIRIARVVLPNGNKWFCPPIFNICEMRLSGIFQLNKNGLHFHLASVWHYERVKFYKDWMRQNLVTYSNECGNTFWNSIGIRAKVKRWMVSA